MPVLLYFVVALSDRAILIFRCANILSEDRALFNRVTVPCEGDVGHVHDELHLQIFRLQSYSRSTP